MAPRSRRPSKASIKAAADRAEARAKGEEVDAAPAEPSALNPPVHPGGRPTEYEPGFCDIAASACSRGATIAEIAEILKVHRSTIYRWMAEHQEFCDAIRIAQSIADERVGFSMYERAVGYTYNAVKILQDKGSPVIVPYVEHVPPDVGAGKFWLTNRQPDKWADISRKEITGKDGEPFSLGEDQAKLELARWIAFKLATAPTLIEGGDAS
jgi:hypothetical protein